MRGLKQLALVLVLALFVNVLPAYAAGASDEAIDAFETALGNAQAVGTKDLALVTEVALAEAVDSDALSDSELAAYTDRLNELVAANDEVLATLTTATVDYVKSTELTKSFNSNFANFFSNSQTYEIGDKKYLRIQVSTSYGLTFVVNGNAGTPVQYIGEAGSYTAIVRDYELPSFIEPTISYITYVANGYNARHDQYIVLNQDATADDRTALTAAITTAEAVETKDLALTQAIADAKAANNLLSRKATLAAHVTRLNELVAANDEVLATLATATVDYVKSTELTKSFNSNFTNFFSNSQTYKIGDKKYLRIQVSTSFGLTFVVNGNAGTPVQYIGEAGSYTAIVRDYELPSFIEPTISYITYVANGYNARHDQYIVLNQDATADDRTALTAAITTAEAVETKDLALTQAIADAKAANNLLSRKATLAAHVTRLNELVAANDEVLATLATATVDYVKSTELTKSFNSNFTNFFSNSQTYKIGDKKYLRIQVSTSFGLTFVVNGNAGTPVQYIGEAGSYTAIVRDYELPSFIEPTISYITYVANGYNARHDQYIVLNQDATEEARTALKSSIATAEAIVNKSDALGQALAAAKDADNLLSRLATLTSATQALNNAIAANTSSTPISTTPVGTDTTGTDTEDTTGTDTDTQENTTTPTNPNNGGGSTTPAGSLKDIQGNWAQASIERAAALNLVTGYTDGTFKPNATINRVEFTAIIVRALGLQPAQSTLTFADSDKVQAWAKQYVQQAVEAGIINGFADQTFRPTANISRVELAVMLVRGLKLELEEGELNFKDASAIPAWAKAYVATAVKYGLLQGSTDGSFNPAKEATRAEAITVALRAVDFLAEKAAANS